MVTATVASPGCLAASETSRASAAALAAAALAAATSPLHVS